MIPNTTNIKYFHNNNLSLFCDYENIQEFHLSKIHKFKNQNIPILNTWIGQNNYTYMESVNIGCSYENHLFLAKKLAKSLGLEVEENLDKYIPHVNYELIPNIDNIKTKVNDLRKNFEKIVLISNGNVHSGQSSNFDFTYVISTLAQSKPNILFLVTKEINLDISNVINTSTITQVIPDLLQISYISNFCDIIIGRASGPFCFSHTKENLLNKNKIFISFCNNKNEGIFYQNQKSKYIWNNNYDNDNMLSIINKCNL